LLTHSAEKRKAGKTKGIRKKEKGKRRKFHTQRKASKRNVKTQEAITQGRKTGENNRKYCGVPKKKKTQFSGGNQKETK